MIVFDKASLTIHFFSRYSESWFCMILPIVYTVYVTIAFILKYFRFTFRVCRKVKWSMKYVTSSLYRWHRRTRKKNYFDFREKKNDVKNIFAANYTLFYLQIKNTMLLCVYSAIMVNKSILLYSLTFSKTMHALDVLTHSLIVWKISLC